MTQTDSGIWHAACYLAWHCLATVFSLFAVKKITTDAPSPLILVHWYACKRSFITQLVVVFYCGSCTVILSCVKDLGVLEKLTWFSEELGSSTAVLLWFASLFSELTLSSGPLGDTPVAVQGFTWKNNNNKINISVIVFLSLWPSSSFLRVLGQYLQAIR